MKFHSEAVNKPSHYAGDIECIDAMVQQFGFETVKQACVVQAFEMLWRWQKKGDPDENLAKACWWLNFAQGNDPRTTPPPASIDSAKPETWNGLGHRKVMRVSDNGNKVEVYGED